jgi:hypothetical protein
MGADEDGDGCLFGLLFPIAGVDGGQDLEELADSLVGELFYAPLKGLLTVAT